MLRATPKYFRLPPSHFRLYPFLRIFLGKSSIAGAILVEASLSFLGIGMPADAASWGKLLRFARSTSSAWWLAVFPGMAIFLMVTIFNLLGEAVSEEG